MANFMERLVMMADLPDEPIPGQPILELAGDRRVLIEHHRGVTEYGRTQIRVRVKYGSVIVAGRGLELARMTPQQLVITGCIDSISLERRD